MRNTLCIGLMVAFLLPVAGLEGQSAQHPLKTFIAENAGLPDRVTAVQSKAAKRWGKVALGAVLGAAAGYVHGRATGGDAAKEAAIGAVAGGAVAFAVTKIRDRRLASRDELVAKMQYDSAEGYRGGIEELSVTPSSLGAGETVTITASYWALSPHSVEKLGMSRYAGLAISGAYLKGFTFKPDPMGFGDGGGQYETTIELKLPEDVSPGSYDVVWLVDGHSVLAEGQTTFTVTG